MNSNNMLMKKNKKTIENPYIISLIRLGRSSLYLYLSLLGVIMLVRCGNNDDPLNEDPGTTAVEITPNVGIDLYGFIGDENDTPVQDVVVSDGFTCTKTDSKGIYQMKKNADAKFVFYSSPESYAVNTSSETVKMASFYASIGNSKRFDFKLKKLAAVESSFTLLCIGDPQVTSAEEINRFKSETMDDIKTLVASEPLPCYALSMGDMVGDKPAFFEQMKVLIGSGGMPVFATIGNHDKVATSNVNDPRTTNTFNGVFGPLNYSFNRGDVHFVCLDDVIFSNSSAYSGGFTDSQLEWLKQDLSYVPKNKMVIVYYHIPLRGTSSVVNRSNFFNALQGFAEVHLMTGHTHYSENYEHSSPLVAYEHVHAAACGSWWRSTINGDGTPNGYAVYSITGNTIKSWYYKPTRYDKDFQLRLHKGNVSFGGAYGYYNFNQADNTIVANVWNADSSWKVEAYENGSKVATLSPMSTSSKDAWSLGYHIGVLNRDPDNYSPACKHLYLYHPQNESANLEIRTTDRFGKVYRQSQITINFTSAISY